ncbi:MAG TPA: methionine--tRNA ligase [Candidatus Paceibacterota bacterium]|nr:methionine--tRNA ligase [Candidatus Paceibacterota bacterium]
MSKTFYITTTLPYVNAEPHMGHALEFVRADIIARWKKIQGYEVFFNTGTDEHGLKILKASKAANVSPKEYADTYSDHFREVLRLLGVSDDVVFTRTTDAGHESATQEFWKRVQAKGYIYKKNYQTKYCVACEEAKTESELVDGRCPVHPTLELELIDEENYFFKFSAFGDRLLKLYDSGAMGIVPESRMNEMREFVKRGLIDFSISRLKSKMPWGVSVPGDNAHVMYVWMDALPSYISALGWPENAANFEKFWVKGTPTQYCGKDNTRFQSVMWQAMLMAAELPPTHTVVVNGFVTAEGGIKMSKSLGNVVNPVNVVNEYGTDALRYFVAREIGSFEDSPFTMDRFKGAYNTGLANGLGNLVSRVMKMATTNLPTAVVVRDTEAPTEYVKALDSFDIKAASDIIWKHIAEADQLIQEKAPFKLVKTDKIAADKIVIDLVSRVYDIAALLEPILPATAASVKKIVRSHAMPAAPLFLRKD